MPHSSVTPCGAVITLFPDILRSLLPGNFQGRGNRAFFPAPAAACGEIGGHKKRRCGIPGWGPSAPLFVSLVFELADLPAPQLLPDAAVHLQFSCHKISRVAPVLCPHPAGKTQDQLRDIGTEVRDRNERIVRPVYLPVSPYRMRKKYTSLTPSSAAKDTVPSA